MKKRLLCVLLVAVLLLGALTGCGGDANSSGAASFAGGSTPAASVGDSSEKAPEDADTDAEPPDDFQDLGIGTPVEEPDDGLGEGVYVVTRYGINNLVANFVSYACECAASGKPYMGISALASNGHSMPVSGSLSLLQVDSRMALDSDYEDNYFNSLFQHLTSLAPRGNRTIRSYNVSVETDWANFYDFHYYQNTEAVLFSKVRITVNYVDANNESKDTHFYHEFQFVNETDNPEQWLILARSNRNDKTKLLLNEDGVSNNLYWIEVYNYFLSAVGEVPTWSEEQDRPNFKFFDVDSDGLPELCYNYSETYRINENNVPERCEIENDEFYAIPSRSFMDAVRYYEIYTERMNNGTAEILRAYQEIIPEDFNFESNSDFAVKFAVDDFGSDQIMMFFDGALYQYKDGKAVKAFDFSEFEGLDGTYLLGMDDEKTVFHVVNSFYDAANDVTTRKWVAIDAEKFTIINTLTINCSGVWPDYAMDTQENFISAFFDGEEIDNYDTAYNREHEFFLDGWLARPLEVTVYNVKDAYKSYIQRCTDLNYPVY